MCLAMKPKKTYIHRWSFFLFFFLLGNFQFVEAANSYGPKESMQTAVEEIMVILNDDQLSLPENKKTKRMLILAVIRHRFDFEEISKRTLAKQWKKINTDEKKEFVDLFSQLLENSYVSKIEAYSDEEIVFLKETVKGRKAEVPTFINHNNAEIPINYMMLLKEDKWRVYDVVIEGVSLVRNYRSQFKNILRKEKYVGLVKRIDEKLEKIAAGTE